MDTPSMETAFYGGPMASGSGANVELAQSDVLAAVFRLDDLAVRLSDRMEVLALRTASVVRPSEPSPSAADRLSVPDHTTDLGRHLGSIADRLASTLAQLDSLTARIEL